MSKINKNIKYLSLLTAILVLWLSLNLINQRQTITKAGLDIVSQIDDGSMFWMIRNFDTDLNNYQMSFYLNSLETDVDSLNLKFNLPNEVIRLNVVGTGVFEVNPELIIDGKEVFLIIDNISYQGIGELVRVEFLNYDLVDGEIGIDSKGSFLRSEKGKVLIKL